jgi:protein-S-isoprenylcysteine O-methyltransferase Ste14
MAFGSHRPRIRLSIFFGTGVFVLFCLCRSRWDEQHLVVSAFLFLLGMLLVGVATLGRAWCSLYIAGYKTTTLVTQGPYSISRNPLYFFSLIGLVGVGLCSETVLIPTILVAAFALYYPITIREEEAKLLEVHGQAYRDYAAATPRFLPKLSKLSEPQQYVVNPKVFRKHLGESMLFVWIVGMLELAETLQELGWLPVVLRVY